MYKTGVCAPNIKLSPEAKPRDSQLYPRRKRPFLLEVRILFIRSAEGGGGGGVKSFIKQRQKNGEGQRGPR